MNKLIVFFLSLLVTIAPAFAALNAQTVWEVESGGSDNNGGGIGLGGNTYAITDFAATSANTSAPVLTSATYTFVAGDVGAYVYIASGTNWIQGEYKIASVATGAATLTGACATVASPTAGTGTVDYTQQNAAQIAYTDLVIGATTTQLTSAANPFTANLVGNIINITNITGFTAGFYQIVSVAGGTATMDRLVGVAASFGGVGDLGGALATLSKLSGAMVGSNKAFVQGGTYSTGNLTFSQSVVPAATVPPSRLIGYSTIRTDKGKPQINFTTASGNQINITGNGWIVRNLSINGNSGTGILLTMSSYSTLDNCKLTQFANKAFSNTSVSNFVTNCEFTSSVMNTASSAIVTSFAEYNYVHDLTPGQASGINLNSGGSAIGNILANITGGAGSYGIYGNQQNIIANNTIYNVTGSGVPAISFNAGGSNYYLGQSVINNIISNCPIGIQGNVAAGTPANSSYDGNVFYSCTTNRVNCDDKGSVNPIDSIAPYTNVNDIICTSSPFISTANKDFRLNFNPGGGAACQSVAFPSLYPGLSSPNSQNFGDMGALQHQAPGTAR